MQTSILLTIIADDHPGIVNTVSEVLYKHGGTWTESSMASLAGQFAGILLALVDAGSAQACVQELQELESKGLHVLVKTSETPTEPNAMREYVLDLVGNDRRGIVHDITAILARNDINVQHLETVVESGPMGGGEIFKASARLAVPEGTNIDALEADLEDIANELMVTITLEQ